MTASITQTSETPAMAEFLASPLFRALLSVLGGALVVAAFGLWLMPFAQTAPMLLVMKFGVSLFMLIAGMCLVVLGRDLPR
jgi:hypothetical protein